MSFIFRWLIFIVVFIVLSPLLLLCLPLSLLTLLTNSTLHLGQVRGQTLWEAFNIYKIIFKAIYNTIFPQASGKQ